MNSKKFLIIVSFLGFLNVAVWGLIMTYTLIMQWYVPDNIVTFHFNNFNEAYIEHIMGLIMLPCTLYFLYQAIRGIRSVIFKYPRLNLGTREPKVKTVFSIHTVLLLFVMMVNTVILVVTVGTVLICVGLFGAWLWKTLASPPTPPWKRYHIGLTHVNTVADTNIMKNGRLVLRNYKTAL